jgi:hypothetical protein
MTTTARTTVTVPSRREPSKDVQHAAANRSMRNLAYGPPKTHLLGSGVNSSSPAYLVTYHQDGAVRVANDGVGDAAYQHPAYRAQAPAADHYHAHAEALSRAKDLLVRISTPEVSLRHLPAVRPDLLRLLLEERLGVPLGPPMRDSLISSG